MKPNSEVPFRACGLVKHFGAVCALAGVDLEVVPGSVTVLLGPNGAGKSTLLRLALGVLEPDGGELVVAGLCPMRRPDELRRRVGYVPDRPDAPPWMTIDELFRFARPHYPTWDDAAADALATSLGVPRRTRLGAMSKGQATKAMVVLALAHDPEVLLLDEPFGGLDPLVRDEVLRAVIGALREERRTVLCATHELDLAARIADRVAVLAGGVVQRHGTVAEVAGDDQRAGLTGGLHRALAAAAQEAVSC